MSKHRAYVFTANNDTPADQATLQELECRYRLYGRGVAPTTGATPPPAIIAASIIPTAPTKPSNAAISMLISPHAHTSIQDLYHSI